MRNTVNHQKWNHSLKNRKDKVVLLSFRSTFSSNCILNIIQIHTIKSLKKSLSTRDFMPLLEDFHPPPMVSSWTKIHLSPERFGYLKIWQCLQNKNILRNILASPGLICEASTHAQAVVSQCRSQFYIKQKQFLPFCWIFWHGMKLNLALEIPLDILEIPLDIRNWLETPITNQVCKKSSTYQWLVLAFMVQLFAFCSVVWKSEAQ